MNLTNYTPKGDLKGLPIEVIKQMLIEQVAQGNKEDVTVFEVFILSDKLQGGFNWNETKLDIGGWKKAIVYKDFTQFYKMYPKVKTYPKMMLVWDEEGDDNYKALIEGEFNGKYLELHSGYYLTWNFAKDIEENAG